jgi:hypothetical protein
MGLDSYIVKLKLCAESNNGLAAWDPDRKDFQEVFETLENCDGGLVYEFRNAFQINLWFMRTLNDGKEDQSFHRLEKSHLENLLITIREVLRDKKRAEELLPYHSSGLFGFYSYCNPKLDSHYWETLIILEKDLPEMINKWKEDYKYYFYSY